MRFLVSLPEPHSHLFHVELSFHPRSEEAVLAMPVWTPGSYLVREFARHVEGFSAADGTGKPLPVARLDKHRWKVTTAGAAEVRVRWRVYANDLTVRTSHLDGTHGYFNGANVFFFPEGREKDPATLVVDAPPGWRVSTGLAGGPREFTARDYDELVDAPVEIGTHRSARFEVQGKPHELALWGRGNLDLDAFAADVKKIVETEAALMGPLPYERYLFIVHLSDKRRGGLEHATSTTLNVARMGFAPRDQYEETLSLVAHEFFHLWNVKRLRPAAFIPFDYGREQYTRLLWWFEGVTSYYDHLFLARAGLLEGRRYLKHLGEELTSLARLPGAKKMGLEEASLTAWVKYYRPDENSENSAVSYYLKGECVAFALDCFLRGRGSSLDALVKAVWLRFLEKGVPEDGIERVAGELVGANEAREFFDRFVRGVDPVEPAVAGLGLTLASRRAQAFDDKGGGPGRGDAPRAGWLGAELSAVAGRGLVVRTVREGSPAFQAGLYAEDEILAEGGFRVDKGELWQRLVERGPGGRLLLTVFRKDELVVVPVTLGEAPEDTFWLEPAGDASEAERAAFMRWCGQPWPAAGGGA